MRKKFPYKIVISSLFLLLCFSTIYSCYKQKKDFGEFIIHETTFDVNSAMDFNNLACINESNKKIIDISTIIFRQNKKVPNLALFLKIKKDHQNNSYQLKQLTKRNMIVIPKPIYNLDLNKDSLGDHNSTDYLVAILDNEINIQIEILDNLKSTTFNPDLKSFAEKSKKILEKNRKDLEASFNL
ncbi:hypothetical protein [Flavobacterium faecale]|uniref:hypothetical protein n=1 Tax=Flavobacterium faecale TaxID=1355330 RepID=UPI003AB09E12